MAKKNKYQESAIDPIKKSRVLNKSKQISTRSKSIRKKTKKSSKLIKKITSKRKPTQFGLEFDPDNIPEHVAIILDGNGRWANKRGLSRSAGHRAGGETLDRLLDFFIELKVPVVSLYAFSTENWKRPKEEVNAIWKLLNEFFKSRSQRAMEQGICIMASGDLEKLPFRSRRIIEKVIQKTSQNKNLIANFCVNYGSRAEITHAFNTILTQRLDAMQKGFILNASQPVQEFDITNALYTCGLPDVDLLLRPGGEFRISNFLLWQCAYAEIYVTDTLWPDFAESDIIKAVHWYQNRNRRFGGL